MIYRIRLTFDAAHFLPNYDGKCSRMHGHTWRVIFCVAVPGKLDESGIGTDFKLLRKALGEVLPDHELINDYLVKPSAEEVARWLLARAIGRLGKSVLGLELWESESSGVDCWAAELDS